MNKPKRSWTNHVESPIVGRTSLTGYFPQALDGVFLEQRQHRLRLRDEGVDVSPANLRRAVEESVEDELEGSCGRGSLCRVDDPCTRDQEPSHTLDGGGDVGVVGTTEAGARVRAAADRAVRGVGAVQVDEGLVGKR